VRQPRPWGFRSFLLNLILLLGTVLLFSVALEVMLRMIFAHSLDFAMEMWKYAVQLKQPVANPELSFVHVPNRSAFLMGVRVSINSHRLRDREYSEAKPAGTYRIVILGDSTAFGWGVRLDETVSKILERDLNAASLPPYRHFEVLNAGVGNYDTVQEAAHYETYDRVFHPNLVILEYFINDAEPVPSERHAWLLGRSYLVAFTISRLDTLMQFAGLRPRWDAYYASLYADSRPGFQAAKEALAKLESMTRQDGAELLVAILPELHQINRSYPFEKEQQKIKDALDAKHVPVIGLIEGLRGHGPESSLWVTPEDPHPNAKANSLIAAQILSWVRDHLR
jgi:lysophospholipase L1-like esterase